MKINGERLFHRFIILRKKKVLSRAVIKRRGPEIIPATMNVAPSYFHRQIKENRTKRNP